MIAAVLGLLFSILLDTPPITNECICATVKVQGGWCDPCKVGYVAGLRIPSKLFYTTIDHGHEMDPLNIRCESCKLAFKADGFCDACRIGFYKHKAYYSPFTYCVAHGERVSPQQLSCAVCRKNVEDGGWCDSCRRGVFGNVAVTDRTGFDEAVKAFRRLKLALTHLDKCEICAIAIYSNGMCPKCGLVYEEGKPHRE